MKQSTGSDGYGIGWGWQWWWSMVDEIAMVDGQWDSDGWWQRLTVMVVWTTMDSNRNVPEMRMALAMEKRWINLQWRPFITIATQCRVNINAQWWLHRLQLLPQASYESYSSTVLVAQQWLLLCSEWCSISKCKVVLGEKRNGSWSNNQPAGRQEQA